MLEYKGIWNLGKGQFPICGHTPFFSFGDHPGPMMKKIKTLEEKIGLQYICIDNGCSRGYRRDKPVVNGVEINSAGRVI